MKLKFHSVVNEPFVLTLKTKTDAVIGQPGFLERCRRILWLKLVLYSLLFAGTYFSLLLLEHRSYLLFVLHYILIGFSGILLAFNAAHDAVHGTFSKTRMVNHLIYSLSFNLQGVSALLWRKRHIASHHVFPNVDGCDADIDDNPFLRLSATQPRKPWHRYQHLYATALYLCYTLHWILIKDFVYLQKKKLANLHQLHYGLRDVAEVLLWKIVYFGYVLLLPVVVGGYPWQWVLTAFLCMHAVVSLFFVWTLIISHLCEETDFPVADGQGRLPYTFHWHQLAVSLDYHPESKAANWLFGGFNAHSAHHLFHRLPHTVYPHISRAIREAAEEHRYPYQSLPMLQAIRSHYAYLKLTGRCCRRVLLKRKAALSGMLNFEC